jgi:hypothetical protein
VNTEVFLRKFTQGDGNKSRSFITTQRQGRSAFGNLEQRDSQVCSSSVDASYMGVPHLNESNWKLVAHGTFGASASAMGHVLVPPILRYGLQVTESRSLRQIR